MPTPTRAEYEFATVEDRDAWLADAYPDRECGAIPGSYVLSSGAVLYVQAETVVVSLTDDAYPLT